ncbi:hypothetical protein [Nocardioides bizhenqiangii]|uniref:Uncharacterized protein n=1 Tax=Nocardioides bizhenqiangii TaxID=3095076 RepID=A0ABZ0ZWF3_9ACTN|nr:MULTISPECIES: hypothetical protein [unclassified Nocardioides]MDZ5622238.1 hypothetical protein [Nocardioides sp. HM23]WQQ28587.1 hypothetical protein SHK19_10195 [Nocardioides sp. HM61]
MLRFARSGLVAVALTALTVTGCGDEPIDATNGSPGDPTSSASSTPTSTPTVEDEKNSVDLRPLWFTLEKGQCIGTLPAPDKKFRTLKVADCAEPHDAEVIGPTAKRVTETSGETCARAARRYVGGDPDAGGLEVTWIESGYAEPSDDSLTDLPQNDPYRYVLVCMLIAADGKKLTGSAAG